MQKFLNTLIAILFAAQIAFAQDGPSCPGSIGKQISSDGPIVKLPIRPNPYIPPVANPVILPNDRIIYWCHGLTNPAEAHHAWGVVAPVTAYQAQGNEVPGYPMRKVTSLLPNYAQFSFSSAAQSLHNYMVSAGDPISAANQIEDKRDNFIIGHSQGGIIARVTDKMYADLGAEADRRFGGIVTFGSSHGGAMILNNIKEVEKMGADACLLLGKPLLLDQKHKNMVMDFFVKDQTLLGIQNSFCGIIGDFVIPTMFKDQTQPITNDYKVGAAPIEALNAYTSTLPRVAFYGVEEEPVFYRLLYNMVRKKPTEFKPFEANDDNELVNQHAKLMAYYLANTEVNTTFFAPDNDGLLDLVLSLIKSGNYNNGADERKWAWYGGYIWLRESNNIWKSIIGARVPVVTEIPATECLCVTKDAAGNILDQYSYLVDSPAECGASGMFTDCNLSLTTKLAVSYNEKPSDGTVLAESATAFPGAATYEMPKSNHLQMRNDQNTKECLNKLFNGAFGDYFITPTRSGN